MVKKGIELVSNLPLPSGYSERVKSVLKQHGDQKVTNVTVCRIPIAGGIQKVVNILRKLTRQQVNAQMDKLFHLYLYTHLENGKIFRWEMNETFQVSEASAPSGESCMSAGAPNKPTTLSDWLGKPINAAGPSFFRYDPLGGGGQGGGNCQDHLITLLRGNGMLTSSAEKFIKQDTAKLLGPFTQIANKLAQKVTDTAGKVRNMFGSGPKVIQYREYPTA